MKQHRRRRPTTTRRPATRQLLVHITPEQHAALWQIRDTAGISMRHQIDRAIGLWLAAHAETRTP
jgi:hypothetical protein